MHSFECSGQEAVHAIAPAVYVTGFRGRAIGREKYAQIRAGFVQDTHKCVRNTDKYGHEKQGKIQCLRHGIHRAILGINFITQQQKGQNQ